MVLIAASLTLSSLLVARARMVNGLRVGDHWRGWIVSGTEGESVRLTSKCGQKTIYATRKALWKIKRSLDGAPN